MGKLLIVVIAIVVIIVVAGLAFQLGSINGKNSMKSEVEKYKKVVDYYFPQPQELFSVSGKITEIQGSVLSMETIIENPYVLPQERKTKIVKITINDKTKISKFEMMTGEEKEMNLAELKAGDEINVGAMENIKDKNEFVANSIKLFIVPEIPVPEL